MRLRWIRRDSSAWESCVGLVQTRYLRDHGANIDPSPELFAALSENGVSINFDTRLAVAGVTFGANDASLFCEYYLDAPVEDVVARTTGLSLVPRREEIVEVGPLATSSAGLGGALIKLIPSLCWCRGATSIICTVSSVVASQIRSTGINLQSAGPAFKRDLPAELQSEWGTYYDAGAEVAVIDLSRQGEQLIRPQTLNTALG